MINKTLILISAFIVSACSLAPFRESVARYEVKQHLARLNQQALKHKKEIPNVKYEFRNIEKVAGFYGPKTDTIYIDIKQWSKYSTLAKEYLIIHEIGHAVFKKPHTKSKDCDKFESYMCYKVPDFIGSEYLEKKEKMLEELFKN